MNDDEQLAAFTKAIEKLLHETIRLRRDVVRLRGRIEPYEDEAWKPDDEMKPFVPKDAKEFFMALSASRRCILDAEYHLNAIRGHIEGISSDAISREEMKEWLK